MAGVDVTGTGDGGPGPAIGDSGPARGSEGPGGDVPGIGDVRRLGGWLAAHRVAAGDGPPAVRLIAGGRSNLTYQVDLGGAAGGQGSARLVLRRPPLGHVLPTAHDMSREFRVLTALHPTAVPVPSPIALCEDPGVIGAPFYVMEYVDGVVLRNAGDAALLTAAQAGQLSHRFIEMLAAVHGLDVSAVGLTGFGRPEGYLARQLARWRRQWELSATRPVPGFDELTQRLAQGLPGREGAGGPGTAAPEPGAAGVLVHGDFRLDNMIIRPARDPDVAAVLDWEMSTLGDPLADLGLALVYWTDPGEDGVLGYTAGEAVTTAPGFLTRAELARAYAALTGRDLSRLGYYMAFGCFKLAVVLEGIHARFLQRKTVGEGFEREGEMVPGLVARAHELLGQGG